MKLLVLKGSSHNDVLTRMADQLSAGFETIGVQTWVLPARPADVRQVVDGAFATGGFDGVFAFTAFGADLAGADGRPLYDRLKYGFTGWTLDHPSYQFERLTAPIARRHTICASEHHFRFMAGMGARSRKLLMLPGAEPLASPKAWAERSIPVLVAMSWMGAPERWWDEARGTPVHRLMDAMLERLDADPDLDLGKAYGDAAEAVGMNAPFDAHLSNLVCKLLTHVRQRDRLRLVRGLQAAGLPFTLCGDGWEAVLGPDPRITYRPSLDYAGLNALYGDCKVVLNLNAANGGSERAMTAMAAGAAVVSDRGALLEQTFGPLVRVHDRTIVAGAVEGVADLLDGDRGEATAGQAYRAVREAHLWTHKASEIAAALRAAWP